MGVECEQDDAIGLGIDVTIRMLSRRIYSFYILGESRDAVLRAIFTPIVL